MVVEHELHVNCGSPDMIDQLGQRMPGRGITLRINPGFGHGHSQKTNTGGPHSKHGIWHEQIAECLDRGAKYGLTVTGLHMHIGSGTDMEHSRQVCAAMEKAALEVGRRCGRSAPAADCRSPYREGDQHVDLAAYYQLWDATRERLDEPFGHAGDAGDRAGPLPGRRERLPDRRDSGRQAAGRQHLLPGRRRLQQPRPADPLRGLPSDVDLPSRSRQRHELKCST